MSSSTSPYQVESGIPIPKPEREPYDSYPFSKMGVGDSFFVPIASGRFTDTEKRIRSAAGAYSGKTGTRFTVRRVDGGLRVWRTE